MSLFLSNALANESTNGARVLELDEFIKLTIKNDTMFEQILIDNLSLKYKKSIDLPAKDLVLDVKSQYDVYLGQGNREESGAKVSLAKLFPMNGTELSMAYESNSSLSSDINSSQYTVLLSQPIAENAFGKVTRLLDKISGIEVDIAKHQISEAYEDYYAAAVNIYYDWHKSYHDLQIAQSSYRENMKLLENMQERRKQKVALDIDVNKTHVQLLEKKGKLIDLSEAYERALNTVKTAIRFSGKAKLKPNDFTDIRSSKIDFDKEFSKFKDNSRTYATLELLKNKSAFELDKRANELLPSIEAFAGYNVYGSHFNVRDEENKVYAGLSFSLPIGDQVGRAKHEIAKIEDKKVGLQVLNTDFQLRRDLENLYLKINREKDLLELYDEKVKLAKAILDDESKNYSLAKISLNDYIQAVNTLDSNKFNQVNHKIQLKKLLVEWMRLTDQLLVRP